MDNKAEKYAFGIIIILLGFSMSGVHILRYAFYLSPLFCFFIWLAFGNFKFYNYATPFLLLLLAGLPSVYDVDFNGFKMFYFIFVYSFLFSIFNFSKIEIDFRWMLFYLFFLFILSMRGVLGSGQFSFSIMNSESSFESTLAFPVGLIAVYFFTVKRYFWFLLASALCILMLKRIVLLAIIALVLLRLCNKLIQRLILNPYVVTLGSAIGLVICIEFATGSFDQLIHDTLKQSANQLAMGRQVLWSLSLKALNFNYFDYMFWGAGENKVVYTLNHLFMNAFKTQDVRLHNDLLLIILQYGILIFLAFVFMLNNRYSLEQRGISLFMTIIFMTDNVLIYQHVMVFYFFIMSQLERADKLRSSSP
ncbi:hypothetical protein [Methylomonas sp. HYX-M1]|uniref:hypothetical protein n=1 Tax=Methylomonas sp. HYX-M1 TaxID=3139307 RepID=UPI00345C1B17